MDKSFLVLVDGKIWIRKGTEYFALKLIAELNKKWADIGSKTRAVIGYDITGGN